MRLSAGAVVLFLGLSCSSSQKESGPFDAPPEKPWEVELALQEVRPLLTHVGGQILDSNSTPGEPFLDMLRRGSPVLSAGLGRWKSFEGHKERAFLAEDKSSLSVLYSYEAHLDSDEVVAVHGEGALRFVADKEGESRPGAEHRHSPWCRHAFPS